MVSNVAYSVSSMVRDYHEYLHVWDAAIGEVLPYSNEDGNLHDPYAVENRVPSKPRPHKIHIYF